MTPCHPWGRSPGHREPVSFASELRFAVGSVTDRAVSLAMTSTCAVCYREDTRLCRDCRIALRDRLRATPNDTEAQASRALEPLAQIEWCAPYTGMTRRAIDRLSDDGERLLSGPLGEAIAHRWRLAGGGGDIMVPVPASAAQNRNRGFDAAVLLARVARARLHLPVVEALRRRSKRVPTPGEGFEVIAPQRIVGRSVVLVDDVVGSGERLLASAVALLSAGARAVSAVTVASDRPSRSEPPTLN
jgi:predicted amidophosphoribosyltransferase